MTAIPQVAENPQTPSYSSNQYYCLILSREDTGLPTKWPA